MLYKLKDGNWVDPKEIVLIQYLSQVTNDIRSYPPRVHIKLRDHTNIIVNFSSDTEAMMYRTTLSDLCNRPEMPKAQKVEVNSLLTLLRSLRVVEIVGNHFAKDGIDAPRVLLETQIQTVQKLLEDK